MEKKVETSECESLLRTLAGVKEKGCEVRSKLLKRGSREEYMGTIVGLMKGDTTVLEPCNQEMKAQGKDAPW